MENIEIDSDRDRLVGSDIERDSGLMINWGLVNKGFRLSCFCFKLNDWMGFVFYFFVIILKVFFFI